MRGCVRRSARTAAGCCGLQRRARASRTGCRSCAATWTRRGRAAHRARRRGRCREDVSEQVQRRLLASGSPAWTGAARTRCRARRRRRPCRWRGRGGAPPTSHAAGAPAPGPGACGRSGAAPARGGTGRGPRPQRGDRLAASTCGAGERCKHHETGAATMATQQPRTRVWRAVRGGGSSALCESASRRRVRAAEQQKANWDVVQSFSRSHQGRSTSTTRSIALTPARHWGRRRTASKSAAVRPMKRVPAATT